MTLTLSDVDTDKVTKYLTKSLLSILLQLFYHYLIFFLVFFLNYIWMIPDFNTSKISIEDSSFLVTHLLIDCDFTQDELLKLFDYWWLLIFSFINAISILKHFSITFFFENNDS